MTDRHESARELGFEADMKRPVGPLAMISVLVVVITALVAGIWTLTVPNRILAEMKEWAQARGIEFNSTRAHVGYDSGLAVIIDGVTVTSASSGLAGTAKSVTVLGLMPWSTRHLVIDRPDFTHEVPVLADVARGTKSGLDAGPALTVGDIQITEGRFRVADTTGLVLMDVAELSGSVAGQSQGHALFNGRGNINGHRTTWRMELEDVARLGADGTPADVFIAATDVAKPFDLQFSGRLRLAQGFSLDGRFSSAASDARSFLSFLQLPDVIPVHGALAAEGGVSLSSEALKLNDLSLAQGEKEGKGRLAISFGRDGYGVDGALDLPSLVLPSPASTDFWSDKPFAVPTFSRMRGTLDIRALTLSVDGYRADAPRLALRFEDVGPSATLTAGKDKEQLSVTVTQRLQQSTPDFSMSAKVALPEAGPFLKAMTGKALLTGGIAAQTDLTARGQDFATLLSTASGTVELKTKLAGVEGYSLRGLFSVPGTGWRSAPDDATKDIEAEFSAVVSDGIVVLNTRGAKIDGASHAISGEIDVLRRSLALDVTPRGGQRIGIAGPWSEPVFGPDVEGAPQALPVAAQTPASGN